MAGINIMKDEGDEVLNKWAVCKSAGLLLTVPPVSQTLLSLEYFGTTYIVGTCIWQRVPVAI